MINKFGSLADEKDVEVVDNPESRYYELRYDGQTAGMLVYETVGSRRVLTHTTIKEDHRGRGLSRLLIRSVLDDLAAKGATITNYCPVVDRFIERNPEYEKLIDPGHPGSWARGRARS
ncbi:MULTISPECIES: GNAT family N-acetyltransferase [unclassified Streptomyces]|uniref:GNAT family N-acetyltransferase n=1 Tax=unclassified Streptomyces TaxID=2593676 RepID=UPI00068A3765|nr:MULTISPECIES: GNAT family N-acetyltransferase [unclassified Streptomyces]